MADPIRPTRFYSKRQEKHIAKELGGRRQANSGATAFQKGDVVLDDWLLEAKTCTTVKKSFSIKREWLDKNKEEAFAMRKPYNALVIDFGDGEQFYMVDEKTFKVMLDYMQNM